jgi:hypothetical protein
MYAEARPALIIVIIVSHASRGNGRSKRNNTKHPCSCQVARKQSHAFLLYTPSGTYFGVAPNSFKPGGRDSSSRGAITEAGGLFSSRSRLDCAADAFSASPKHQRLAALGLDGLRAYMKDCNLQRYPQLEHADGMGKARTRSGKQRAGRALLRLKTLDALDRRTHAARRAGDLVSGLESDLGGSENVTVAEHQIVQHAGVLGAVIEHQETLWLGGEEVDETALLTAINCQRRLLEAIGLQRRARDVTPTLAQYIKQIEAETVE